MDAVEFIKERRKMYAGGFITMSICDTNAKAEDVVAEVEKWSREHPRKTRQSEFLKQFPNAKIFVDGVLDFCPIELDKYYPCKSTDIEMRCQSCRQKFWMQEVE